MAVQFKLGSGKVLVKTCTDDVDSTLLGQLGNLMRPPVIRSHVTAMLGVYVGASTVLGSAISTKGVIISITVVVNVGCGVSAIRVLLGDEGFADSLVKRCVSSNHCQMAAKK